MTSKIIPVSRAQIGMFRYLRTCPKPDNVGNLPGIVFLKAEQDEKRLIPVLKELLACHSSLNATIDIYGEVCERIDSANSVVLDTVCLAGAPATKREVLAAIAPHLAGMYAKLDLKSGTVIVFRLFKFSNGDFDNVLTFASHHVVMDGHSIMILAAEIMNGIEQADQGAPVTIPTASCSIEDYVGVLECIASSDELMSSVEYWNNLEVARPTALSPMDFDHQAVHWSDYTWGGSVDFSEETLSELARAAFQKYAAWREELLFAVVSAGVMKWCQSQNILISSLNHGRNYGTRSVDPSTLCGLYWHNTPILLQSDSVDRKWFDQDTLSWIINTYRLSVERGLAYLYSKQRLEGNVTNAVINLEVCPRLPKVSHEKLEELWENSLLCYLYEDLVLPSTYWFGGNPGWANPLIYVLIVHNRLYVRIMYPSNVYLGSTVNKLGECIEEGIHSVAGAT